MYIEEKTLKKSKLEKNANKNNKKNVLIPNIGKKNLI